MISYRMPKQKDNFTIWKAQLDRAIEYLRKDHLTDKQREDFLTIPLPVRIKADQMIAEGTL